MYFLTEIPFEIFCQEEEIIYLSSSSDSKLLLFLQFLPSICRLFIIPC